MANRFHDPGAAGAPPERLHKEMIFTGQRISAREKVAFGRLHGADVPLQAFAIPFQIFHHEVFASQL